MKIKENTNKRKKEASCRITQKFIQKLSSPITMGSQGDNPKVIQKLSSLITMGDLMQNTERRISSTKEKNKKVEKLGQVIMLRNTGIK